ncbi:MAG: efflux RND transporter permease subunit [Rhodothermales bacterium]
MLPTLSTSRPVGTTALYILVTVLAVAAIARVPVELLPDLRFPGLVVWTAYPDVPPERVERAVTEPIEQAVAGTEGLQRITSRTQLGGSLVRLDFGWNANLDLSLLNVREQLDRLGEALPEEADRPVVLRLDPSDRPIMMLALRESLAPGIDSTQEAVSSEEMNLSDAPIRTAQDLVGLKRLAREVIARRIEQLDDVARVRVTGGFDPRVEIVVDPERLATFGLGIEQLSSALMQANVSMPGGVIRRGPFRYAVEVSGEFRGVEDISETVVSTLGGRPLRLRDVATVRESVEERRGFARFDGEEALLLLVERRPDANTVRAAESVRDQLVELGAEVPGVDLDVVVDESVFVRESISGVLQAVIYGGVLAILVLFLFLRHFRSLIAVALAIPMSLAITLILFDLLHVSFNLISLSGLALGVGMLVDNAIVVVENITRLREKGLSAFDAALRGTKEVSGAITASTLTTIAVFLPITFVEGLAGRLFRDQSLAVVSSLAASLFVALTLVPMVLSRGRDRKRQGADEQTSTSGGGDDRSTALDSLTDPSRAPVSSSVQVPVPLSTPDPARRDGPLIRNYERILDWSLDHKPAILLASLVLLVASGILLDLLPRQVLPDTDQGRVAVRLALPPESDVDLVATRAAAFINRVRASGIADHALEDLGERDEALLDLNPRPPYESDVTLLLKPDVSVNEAQTVLGGMKIAETESDVEMTVAPVRTQLEALLVSEDADILIDLISDDRAITERVVPEVLQRLESHPELENVRRSDAATVPAYEIAFKRDNMSRFGASPATVTSYLEAGARGRKATDLRSINEDVPIVIRSRHVNSIDRLLDERVPTRAGLMPLSEFIETHRVELPAALVRSDQGPVVRLEADIASGGSLQSATQAVKDELDALPATIRSQVGGASEAFGRSLRAVLLSLALSVLLVYLILAAQFESLVQPIIVLTTVPLAIAGVSIVLAVTGNTVNLMSLTGCVVLVGIVVNDAIVKVDFINQRRRDGAGLRDAIREAGHDRVRPIIMTTITTILGLLPLAMGFGLGAELRAPLAVAVVGGLAMATVLTLVVVPVLYELLARPAREVRTESRSGGK